MLILSEADLRRLLPPAECIPVMREALAALARGDVEQPVRRPVLVPPGAAGLLAAMPAYTAAPTPAFGLKAVCVFPGNPAAGLDAHQGAVLLFSGTTGEPLALLNASTVTELRTPAVTAVATDLLARPDATELVIAGAGVQGVSHARALARVRPFRRIRLAARDAERARAACARLSAELDLPVEPADSLADAVATADVVVTATTSPTPILDRSWLRPGTHVNAIGSSVPSTREIDTATMASATVFADSAASVAVDTGDYLFAAAETAVSISASIGEVLIGTAPGRTSPDEITLFKSVGLPVEDLFAARHAVAQARSHGLGQHVEI
ncbi:ornithine cyclodeaminase family protein [Dactylosporangium sp. CA-092794]|uniref:ornithine cyclodeaminase family protein n=1 Tax=Dactylosporangium sp. CA-092794 TaxID=3239929 RepID=UPI003D8A1AD4